MTKQKFYELCIKKTFELAQDDEDSPYYEIANQIKFDESFLKKSSSLSLNGSTSSKSLDLLCRIGKIQSL